MPRGIAHSRTDLSGLFSEWDIYRNTSFGRKTIWRARAELGLRAPFTAAQVYRMVARCHAIAGAREVKKPPKPRTYKQVWKRKQRPPRRSTQGGTYADPLFCIEKVSR